VFNVLFPDGRLGSIEAKEWAENNGMKFVPIIDEHYVLPDSVKEVLEYAHGTSKLYDTLREGIVFRSKDGKQSFKAVDPLFLLKYDE
jgi:molybdate-binding protein